MAEQYCLKWNNHQTTLVSVFTSLLDSGNLSDCILSAEGESLQAHQVVISACSPYLDKLLNANRTSNQFGVPILIFNDLKIDELRAMREYMYKGEVNIAQENLNSFLRAAQALQIKGLAEQSGSNNDRSGERGLGQPLAKRRRRRTRDDCDSESSGCDSGMPSAPVVPPVQTEMKEEGPSFAGSIKSEPPDPGQPPTKSEPVQDLTVEDEEYDTADYAHDNSHDISNWQMDGSMNSEDFGPEHSQNTAATQPNSQDYAEVSIKCEVEDPVVDIPVDINSPQMFIEPEGFNVKPPTPSTSFMMGDMVSVQFEDKRRGDISVNVGSPVDHREYNVEPERSPKASTSFMMDDDEASVEFEDENPIDDIPSEIFCEWSPKAVTSFMIGESRQQFCVFCKKIIAKLPRHLLAVHRGEEEVKQIARLPPNLPERKKLIEKLRKDGIREFNAVKSKTPAKKPIAHYCVFCGHMYINIARHFSKSHNDEEEVKFLQSFPASSRTRKIKMIHLCKIGSFLFKGQEGATSTDNLACPNCQEMYTKKTLYKHYYTCPGR